MNSVTTSVGEIVAAHTPGTQPLDYLTREEAAALGNPSDSYGLISTALAASSIEARAVDEAPILVLSLCLTFAVAVIVGLVTGILSRIDAASHARAALCGGAAFGTTLLVGIALIALL